MTKLSITLRHPNDQTPPVGYAPGYQRAVTDPMTRAEECQAFEALRAGDESQRDRITQANLRFVFDVAKHFEGQGLDREDLVQEGICGMMVAVDKFDHTLGWKFISYAVHWIRQALHAATGSQGPIYTPLNQVKDHYHAAQHRRKMEATRERPVSLQEAAEDLGLPPSYLPPAKVYSLDSPRMDFDPDTDQSYLANATPDTLDVLAVEPEDHTVEDELRQWVAALLENRLGYPFSWTALTPREADILRAYYGFGGCPPLTLEQIGANLGITRERVRQLNVKALSKLKARIGEQRGELMEMVG